MNNLVNLINQFKEKNVFNICYQYTKLDKDIAVSEFVEHQIDGTLPDFATDSNYFLRSQDNIFPVKTSDELTWLCGLLFLFDMKNLLELLHNLLSVNNPFLLILKGDTYVDNDKHLEWAMNTNGITVRYQGKRQTVSLNDPKIYDKDSLIMAIGHFIYINVVQGRL